MLMEELRWPDGPECPHCGATKAYFLTPKNAAGRRSGPGEKRTVRRVWKCAKCRKQFSVLTGTIFHGTKVPLADWLQVMVLMSASKNGIASREVERLIGVTAETAWFMTHRLREAMRRGGVLAPFEGVVVADETFIGGEPKNRHSSVRNTPVPLRPGERRGHTDKASVLSLINTATGEVRSKVIPDVTGATLRKAIAEQADMGRTELHTDEWSGYKPVTPELLAHRTVNHSDDEYVRREGGRMITTNPAEGLFLAVEAVA